jgi:glycosyltransferase involved in cell wall biosynthesis
MKIAYVSNMVEPTGGDHIVYHHVIGLRKLGHTVDPYFSGWHESYRTTIKNWNTSDAGQIFSYEYNKINSIDFSSYDLIVANGLYGANQALSIKHPNKVWFCQNFDPYIFGKNDETDRVYQGYDNYLLYSNDLKKIIRHYYGNKNFVLCNNGVEYNTFKPFQKTGFQKSKRICFMVAYYRNYKGIKFANQIFTELKKRGFITVEINVVGGPLESTMEYYRDPSLARKAEIVASCDFSIHPSVFETWNLTSMESMALGTPVVGVNSRGIMEYANGSNSIIFEDRKLELICDAIEGLYSDENRYLELQKGGIETSKQHDWDLILPQIESSYNQFLDEMEREYQLACNGTIAEDIHEHIPVLRKYASLCSSIVELGVRMGASTRAFLAAKPKSLLSVDIIPIANEVRRLRPLVNNTNWQYIMADDLKIQIEGADMLFIDTYHAYDQLIQELKLHGNKARKFIILHDTTTWGEFGHGGAKGLTYAVNEFLSLNPHWAVREEFKNNNGLLILERKNV